ncbi:MAG: VWA domain-containing protein [Myxococcales bacterium]|nr:VWA domain-containing protein [Myxococcales bacterium]
MTIAGVAGGLTVIFYILKLRRRPIAVPFSHIWERILRDKEATSWFSQLKRLLSLLFQLALLTLLIMALGDPRLSQNLVEGRNVLVLIDTSASMKAIDGGDAETPTRLDAARKEVAALVRGLGGTDRMLLASMDSGVSPLTTMTGETSDLQAALKQLEATDTRADLRRGLNFALDSLRGLNKTEIVLVSDGAFGDVEDVTRGIELGDTKLSYIPVGKRKRNVAITQFSVRRYPLDKSRYEVMLEVTNTNEEPTDVELTLLGDGQVVDVTTLHLGPNERLPRFYKDLGGASRTLEAVIKLGDGKPDDLPADDHAYALMPERRRSKVLLVTKTNTYLEAALLLDEYLEVSSVEPSAYPPPGNFDVTIFDGVAPPLADGSGAALYLNPPDTKQAPVGRGKKLKMFGFDTWDKKHPVVRWMELGDVQVAEGYSLKPEKNDRVVGASFKGPILVEGRRSGRRFMALGFDPRDSDFVMRVAWPLFVLNTINYFVEEDTGYISSFRTGEVWRIPAPSGAEVAELELPDGTKHQVPIKQGRAVYQGDQAGFYTLRVKSEGNAESGAEGGSQETMFAANLVDLDESRIEPSAKLEIGKTEASSVSNFSAGVRRELWLYLLIAAIIASTVEWLTYHRRLTV